jgi:hypothetical protein
MSYRLRVMMLDQRDAVARLRLLLHERGIAVTAIRRETSTGPLIEVTTTAPVNPAQAGAAVRQLAAQPWIRRVELDGAARSEGSPHDRLAPEGPAGAPTEALDEVGERHPLSVGSVRVRWTSAAKVVEAQRPAPAARAGSARARWSSVRR